MCEPSWTSVECNLSHTQPLTDALSQTTTEKMVLVESNGIFIPSEYFVKTEDRRIAEVVIDFCFSFIISMTGVVTNVIIIIVFSRQGFQESVNISMTTIAVWDLVKSLSGALQRMAGPVALFDPGLAKTWSSAGVVVSNYLISFSSYVSSVLAAYVALERCLCLSIPFTVKLLLTPKFTLVVCLGISFVVFGSFSVVWGIYDFFWVYDKTLNTTIMAYRNNEFYESNKGPLFDYYNISGIVWPLVSFVVIVVCTAIIMYHLRKSAQFRKVNQKTAPETKGQATSQRDRQVIKMLLVIVLVYTLTLSPRVSLYLAKYFIFDFYFLRKYHNLFMCIVYVNSYFDLCNGAVNMFIFLKMSSGFRATFVQLFQNCVAWKRIRRN